MDYYDWVAGQLGKSPTVTDWKEIPNEAVSDPNLTTHAGTMRQTWVGDKVVLTRVVVKPNSRGKPHYHPAEQVSMIVRGGVRVYMNGAERTALAGSIAIAMGSAPLREVSRRNCSSSPRKNVWRSLARG